MSYDNNFITSITIYLYIREFANSHRDTARSLISLMNAERGPPALPPVNRKNWDLPLDIGINNGRRGVTRGEYYCMRRGRGGEGWVLRWRAQLRASIKVVSCHTDWRHAPVRVTHLDWWRWEARGKGKGVRGRDSRKMIAASGGPYVNCPHN